MLFCNVDIGRKVVAETALEIVAHERPERIALVLPLLLDHVGTAEDASVELRIADGPDLQLAGRTRGQVVRNDDVVEQVPVVAVGQRNQP